MKIWLRHIFPFLQYSYLIVRILNLPGPFFQLPGHTIMIIRLSYHLTRIIIFVVFSAKFGCFVTFRVLFCSSENAVCLFTQVIECIVLKRVSVTTTASVCKPTTQTTWALLFWSTWPASSICKPTKFFVTERGFSYSNTAKGFLKNILIQSHKL